ncbi:Pentatricopeptide repeat-containing protein [Zostera marina]|uniref:Pentatricopeptide repeat-containing protein n=1 Tax=Zostera marina TaxID=29655 RepID=A0A0K9NJJ7_ZOSMR|nr:Pentatricopeptide repeat-containing protein [Zostera marina]
MNLIHPTFTTTSSYFDLCFGVKIRKSRHLFIVRSTKRTKSETPKHEVKRKLSHILRTEAAILGVERKAATTTSRTLWPRAVLEALENAVAGDRWESALKIFGLLRKQNWYNPKSQTYARLLTMLGRCKQADHARFLFQIMLSETLKPTVDVYTSLVGAYGYSGRLDEAFRTIDEMKSISDCKPDVYTYTVLINCCCKLRRFDLISKVLSEMSYFGIECTNVTYNTIVDGYGKAGMLEEMDNTVSDMLESGNCLPDLFTLNSIIWAHGNFGQIDKLEKWYDEFQHMGIEPDVTTFNILIKSYGNTCMDEKITFVLDFMKKRCFSPTTVTYNLLIEYFGTAKNVEKMEYIFQNMKNQGIKPNSITYCSLIKAYGKAGLLDKVGLVETMEEMFLMMRERKCKPDTVTIATMIRAYNCQGMAEAVQKLEMQMCSH